MEGSSTVVVSTSTLHAQGPRFVPQVEPWTIPLVHQALSECHKRVGGDSHLWVRGGSGGVGG